MPNPDYILGDGCEDSDVFRVTGFDEVVNVSSNSLSVPVWQTDARGPLAGGIMRVDLELISGNPNLFGVELRSVDFSTNWYDRDYNLGIGIDPFGTPVPPKFSDYRYFRLACCDSGKKFVIIGAGVGSFRIHGYYVGPEFEEFALIPY
jgi:hypothetical protein